MERKTCQSAKRQSVENNSKNINKSLFPTKVLRFLPLGEVRWGYKQWKITIAHS